MTKLDTNNYFTLDNRAISNSRVGDWLKCKNYFKRKHIDGTIDFKKTSAMVTGTVVDEFLTADKITGNYVIGDRRKKEFRDLTDVTVVSEKQYNEMMDLAIAVEETKAYKDLKDYKTQEILQVPADLGPYFDSLAGIPDFYNIEKDKCIIVDLKTSQTVEPYLYAKHAEALGYYRQQAMYQLLLASKYPDIKKFESRHLVVDKTKDIYNVSTFVIDQWKIEVEKRNLIEIFKEIKEERDFAKKEATWENAITI